MVTAFGSFAPVESTGPYEGLYLAGQNVMAPGVIGTIMGSFSTVKLILGADEFRRVIRL